MRKTNKGLRTRKVALVFELQPSQDFLRGIRRYMDVCGNWELVASGGGVIHHWEHLDQIKADGIIALSRRVQTHLHALKQTGLPAVIPGAASDLPHVISDGLTVGWMMADYFIDLGFTNFGHMIVPSDENLMLEKGFCDRLHESGFNSFPVKITGLSIFQQWNEYRERIATWLANLPKPAAILCYSDFRAIGVMKICTEQDIHIPEQIAIAGLGNNKHDIDLLPIPLTSVDINNELRGYECARLLDLQMRKGRQGGKDLRAIVPPLGIEKRMSTNVLHVPDQVVADCLRFIREHATENIHVGDLLRQCRISQKMLELRFHKAIGRTPHREIMRAKLEAATRLITNTSLTVSQIADRTGYGDVRALCVAFKKATGKTPTQFRQKLSASTSGPLASAP